MSLHIRHRPPRHRAPRHRPGGRRVLVAALASVGGAVLLSGCGGDSDASGATVVDVELGRFVIDPASIVVPEGEVELRVTNTDTMVHDLVVASKGTRPLQPGESQTLPMGEVAAGDYRMWCDQPGHAEAGQVGTLSVTPAATAATPG